MELYTLHPETYEREIVIDEYESLVWTERFIEPGDMKLVLPATREMARLARPGTLLNLSTSREPMLVDTRSIEDGMINVAGKTIEAFFNERYIDAMDLTQRPWWMIEYLFWIMQTRGQNPGVRYFPNIVSSAPTSSAGTSVSESIEFGPTHDAMLALARKYFVGMAVYWRPKDSGGKELVFTVRRLRDRTRGTAHPVIFSPDLDNFANVK